MMAAAGQRKGSCAPCRQNAWIGHISIGIYSGEWSWGERPKGGVDKIIRVNMSMPVFR